ncbi:MAG: hypothetical protein ACRDQ0_08425 [Pseudonocardia sp.]
MRSIVGGGDAVDWRATVRDRIGAIAEQADRLRAAGEYLEHLLTCTHEPLDECPSFLALVSSRVAAWI